MLCVVVSTVMDILISEIPLQLPLSTQADSCPLCDALKEYSGVVATSILFNNHKQVTFVSLATDGCNSKANAWGNGVLFLYIRNNRRDSFFRLL